MSSLVFKEGLIVSCQALPGEPLYGGNTMAKMALAAFEGGAIGIRANGVKDIRLISDAIHHALPIIGLIKKNYPDSLVYITPTLREANALLLAPCDVIALDATERKRPRGLTLKEEYDFLRKNTNRPLMADVATLEEAVAADRMGFDFISSTLRGYTEKTTADSIPDIDFLRSMIEAHLTASLIAEGGIKDRETLDKVLSLGYHNVVIGGAITRPKLITEYFAESFRGK
jgi:N-acylglucosamine-6-phosphate 2-epimerase